MRAIILAAGIGSRIAKDISAQHKCLLPVPTHKGSTEQCPLIVSTITALQTNGISDITVITGYLHEQVENAVRNCKVECIYNPFYYLVNSIGSLWFAEHKIQNDNDLLILNADTFMETDLLKSILDAAVNPTHPLLYVDSTKKDTADVKVNYQDTMLQEYGKDISGKVMAESLDLFIVPKALCDTCNAQLKTLLADKQHDTWWESVLIEYQDSTPILICDIAGMFWSEIDFYEDYLRIRNFLA